MYSDSQTSKLVTLIMALRRDGIHDTRVLSAIELVPREQFVRSSYKHLAYENQSLPLLAGQTLSQPFVVAKMTQELALAPSDRVLEIGTGSGYQAAILSHLCNRVMTIERLRTLYKDAKHRLESLDIYNVDVCFGDGFSGWPEAAPFNAIILTCAPQTIPQDLLGQLVIGGRLIAPVGEPEGRQSLKIYTRASETRVCVKTLGLVRFVPMVTGTT